MRRQALTAVHVLGLAAGFGACGGQQQATSPIKAEGAGQGGQQISVQPPAETAASAGMASVLAGADAPRPAAGGNGAVAGSSPPPSTPVADDPECAFGCSQAPALFDRALVTAEPAPPPISGGTLLATRDEKWLVAADPDRDRIYFVDGDRRALSHVRELEPGDEPGRLVEDAAGRIHVALRSGHALITLSKDPNSPITRRGICELPRGLAYDSAHDAIHVACAEGKLVTVPADPSGAATRTLELGRDLRDVIVRGDELLVTRFRSAELLRIGADGSVQGNYMPPASVVRQFDRMTGQTLPDAQQTPTTAWRAIDVPGKGSALLHQRARVGTVSVGQGGYSSGSCTGIMQTSITVGLDGPRSVSADLADMTGAVDLAVNPSGTLLAVVAPGHWASNGFLDTQLRLYSVTGTSPLNPLAPVEPLAPFLTVTAPNPSGGTQPAPCMVTQTRFANPEGQATAVAFLHPNELAVFDREPAAISIINVSTGRGRARVELGQATRYDTGQALFHVRTGGGIACASCHAEAGDDGHVWTFEKIGPRRTQQLRGGILGTEPLHWDGDMKDFGQLADDVFVKRMSGQMLSGDQKNALAGWIDRQPALTARARDAEQAQRGQALFESAAVGCTECHTGPRLTSNRFADVGTGAEFQVPALRGVSFRLPLMHDGCATTLRQRFDAACGGQLHGHTSALSAAQLDDLSAYLETL